MSRNRPITSMRIVLMLFFAVAVFFPLAMLLSNLGGSSVAAIFSSEQFSGALINSCVVSLTTTVLSVSLAIAMAWIVCRTNVRGKGFFNVMLTLPMLIPSLAHGMGLVFLLGKNGLITNLLSLDVSIYGFWGIVLGSLLYSFPPTFLLLKDVMKYEDATPYEAATVLGVPKSRQFTGITLPYLRKPLISIVFATFTLVITDYGVPLVVGGKYMTLPVLMYQEVVGLLNYGTGVAIGLVLLIPAIVAFVLDFMNGDSGKKSFITKAFEPAIGKVRDRVCLVVCLVVSALLFLPIVAFLIVGFVSKYPVDMAFTLANVGRALSMNMGDYLANSLLIAICVSALGTALSYAVGYIAARSQGRIPRILHLASIVTMAIPGIVLGLAYVFAFHGSPIYASFAILIMVNTVHFFASPYLMAYNSLGKVNQNLEAVGATLGIGRGSIIRDVILPQTVDTILEMFSYYFANCMVTISAVAFLSTTLDMPLALLINDFDAQRLTECVAIVALVILLTNCIMKAAIYLIRHVAETRRQATSSAA